MNIPNFPPLNHSGKGDAFASAPSGLTPEFLGEQARHRRKMAHALLCFIFFQGVDLSVVSHER
jgi:hypothetical protein